MNDKLVAAINTLLFISGMTSPKTYIGPRINYYEAMCEIMRHPLRNILAVVTEYYVDVGLCCDKLLRIVWKVAFYARY